MRRLPLRSPLRMRGKGPDDRAHPLVPGITPAYAGKSCGLSFFVTPCRDHPRVCGEKYQAGEAARQSQGSPPRMRGKVSAEDFKPQTGGDHPRVCGEKSGLMRSNATGTGSPPRVRGKDVSGADATPWIRITPACAGKSFTSMKCFRAIQDHPRVCGEKSAEADSSVTKTGSPPRVRGKVPNAPMISASARITPACAGKSAFCSMWL